MKHVIGSYKNNEINISADLSTKSFADLGNLTPIFSPDLINFFWAMPDIDRDLQIRAKVDGQVVG